MRMPALIDYALNELARVPCAALAITVNEVPPSTAVMTITDPSFDIEVGAWVRVYTPHGDDWVATVTRVDSDYGTGVRTVTAEHVWKLLDDVAVVGKVHPGGTKDDEPRPCTPSTALNAALAFGTMWELGYCEYIDSMPYEFSNESVSSAVESVLDTLDGYQLHLDTSRRPFTLSIIRRPAETVSEMRLDRNISTMRVNVDKSDMYNRLYPFGDKELSLDTLFVEDADSIDHWGLVEQTVTVNQIRDKATLKSYAKAALKKYSVPLVTVTISGLDLADQTGEPLDRIVVGKKCRVPLPKYGVTFDERVTRLAWADALKSPDAVTVTMCNTRQNVNLLSNAIKNNKKSSSRSSRYSARSSREASEKNAALANALNGFAGDLSSAWTSIQQNETQIQLAAQIISGEKTLTSSIQVTGGGILSRVSSVENTATGLKNTVNVHSSEIEQLADSIALKADKVTIDASIAKINASVTQLGNIINGGVIQASSITTDGIGINGNLYYHDEKVTPRSITSTSNANYTALGI